MNELISLIENTETSVLVFDGKHFVLNDIAGTLDMSEVRELLDNTKATYGTSEMSDGSLKFRVDLSSRHRDHMVDLCLLSYERLTRHSSGDVA